MPWHAARSGRYLTGPASYLAQVDTLRLASNRQAKAIYAASYALEQYERRLRKA